MYYSLFAASTHHFKRYNGTYSWRDRVKLHYYETKYKSIVSVNCYAKEMSHYMYISMT